MNDDQKREARLRQALSALVDGEAHELEVSQVLAKAKGHDEVKARWARYQLVSAALQARGAAQGSAVVTTAHPAGAALPAAAPLRRGFGWGSFALAGHFPFWSACPVREVQCGALTHIMCPSAGCRHRLHQWPVQKASGTRC